MSGVALVVVGCLFLEASGGLTDRLGAVHAAHGLAGTDIDVLMRLARPRTSGSG